MKRIYWPLVPSLLLALVFTFLPIVLPTPRPLLQFMGVNGLLALVWLFLILWLPARRHL